MRSERGICASDYVTCHITAKLVAPRRVQAVGMWQVQRTRKLYGRATPDPARAHVVCTL